MLGFSMMEMTGTQVTLRGPRTYNDLERAENVGNGEWRSSCSSSFQAAGSMGRAQLLLAWLGDNASMEKAMEEGKRHINLSSRVLCIIKLLPPCLAWLKCHDF